MIAESSQFMNSTDKITENVRRYCMKSKEPYYNTDSTPCVGHALFMISS